MWGLCRPTGRFGVRLVLRHLLCNDLTAVLPSPHPTPPPLPISPPPRRYFTHFSACIFFLLASFDGEQRHHSWLASTPSRGSFGSLIDESAGEQYIAAFYWSAATVLTVGFGDIIPVNSAERMFATVVMFFGSIFFGYVIASMTDLLATLDMNARAVNEKMAALSSYMFKRKFPRGLQLRVKTYYRNYLEKKTGLDESVIISELSTNLQQEVVMHVIYDTIKHVPVFRDRPMHEMAKVM